MVTHSNDLVFVTSLKRDANEMAIQMIEPFDPGGGCPLAAPAVPYHLFTELLALQEHFRVSRLKKHQPYFLQLPVGGQEIFDRSR